MPADVVEIIRRKIAESEHCIALFMRYPHTDVGSREGAVQFREQCRVEVLKEILKEIGENGK